MRGEFTITHQAGHFIECLGAALPRDDRTCLARSLVFAGMPHWQANVAYAAETPQWRLVVYADGINQWQMIVEAVHGDLKGACQSLWRTVHKAAGPLSPRLDRLTIVDDATDQVLLRASVGLVSQLGRREFWLPVAVGLANVVVLVAEGAEATTVRASIPGFAAAMVALCAIGSMQSGRGLYGTTSRCNKRSYCA